MDLEDDECVADLMLVVSGSSCNDSNDGDDDSVDLMLVTGLGGKRVYVLLNEDLCCCCCCCCCCCNSSCSLSQWPIIDGNEDEIDERLENDSDECLDEVSNKDGMSVLPSSSVLGDGGSRSVCLYKDSFKYSNGI